MRQLAILFCSAVLIAGCGVNPVTGKKEIQFISEAQEVKMGEQYYAPTQQTEGGDFDALPELTRYVNEVGQRLAAHADRKLPYEFVVLDNSVPNAWALPGGKIAVNRGLLTGLNNEAELAAVLAHEIVHAAARHGAKAQERGTLLQAGLALAQVGAAIGDVDQNVAGLVLQGAGVGAQLVQTKYGRDQELEADYYGMKYMKLAGYDPMAAVALQETFVRLSEGEGERNWLEGLFASHPPSAERVAKNRATAAELGTGGELGKERFAAVVAPLLKLKPAYDKADQAVLAAQKKDFSKAKALTREALATAPSEGRFHQLLGDLELAEKDANQALPHYRKAIELNPDYFGSYLGAGVAALRAGSQDQAETWLKKSMDLLPTAPAAYYLGTIAKERGRTEEALQYYRAAAGSSSQYAQLATAELLRADLPRNPGNYVATAGQLAPDGRLVLVVENRAPLALADIQVTPVLIDSFGRVVSEGSPVRIREVLNPNQRVAGDAGVGVLSQEQLARVRFRVDEARIAEGR